MSPLHPIAAFLLAITPLTAGQAPALRDLSGVWRADFDSDASHVIVQLRNGGLGIWATGDGSPVPGELGNLTTKGSYVVNGDARRVLVGMQGGGSRVFELATGSALSPMLDVSFEEHEEPSEGFSPDGSLIHVVGENGTWTFLEVATGKRVATLDLPAAAEDREVSPSIRFSKDGGSAYILDGTGTLHRYDTQSWKENGPPLPHPDREAYFVGFDVSPDGRHAVTFDSPGENGPKGSLQLWDLTTSRPLGEPIKEQNGLTGSFLDPGRLLVTPGRGQTRVVKIPSLETEIALPQHDDVEASRAVASTDGLYFYTWGYDGKLLSTDARTGKFAGVFSNRSTIQRVQTAPGSVWVSLDNTAFFPEGHYDYYVARLDPVSLRTSSTLRITNFLHRTILSPDASSLMIHQGGTDKERIRLFNAKTLVELPSTATAQNR